MRKPMHYGAPSVLFAYAKELRGERSTKAERLLWEELKSKKLEDYKFRFQHPFGRYIADFFCHDKKLVVEVDGGYHFEKEQEELDEARTQWLNERGIKVIRFKNEEILKSIESVLIKIKKELNQREV